MRKTEISRYVGGLDDIRGRESYAGLTSGAEAAMSAMEEGGPSMSATPPNPRMACCTAQQSGAAPRVATFAPEPSVCIPWQDASCDCAVARRVPARHVAAVTNAKASATVPETTRERKESRTT